MALRPEERAEWILAQLEGHQPSEALAPPGDTELDRAELAREAADCRETWQALGKLDDRVVSETPSPRVRSTFQEQLADVVRRERARHASLIRPGRILGWVPSIRSGVLAVATAMVVIVAFALWWPSGWSPREVPVKERVASAWHPSPRSASSRLGAVLVGFGKDGPAAAGKLGWALESDSNPNVRLAALEVLAERFSESGFEERIERALARESDPLVRLELIRTIGERRLVRGSVILRNLSRDPSLDDLARDEIARVMARLGS
jgi:HEAT repeat protein